MTNGIGHVYTYRKQEKVNIGNGVIDPTKVFYREDANGKIIIDGVRCSIVREYVPPKTVVIGGKVYHFVKIGNQVWLAENLDLNIGSECNYLNNDETTYGPNGLDLGLLYTPIGVAYLEENKSALFPGWHVPTRTEIETLCDELGGPNNGIGKKLKTQDEWTSYPGDNSVGFCGRPAGRMADNAVYNDYGTLLQIWSCTVNAQGNTFGMQLLNSTDNVGYTNNGSIWKASVRLIKD